MGHWSMHEIEVLWSVHGTHHSIDKGLRARDVLLHSPVDGFAQVFVNIMVQRHTPWGMVKSRLARAIHNVVVTWMLTESHTISPSPRVARRWFSGVRRHRAHHLSGRPYFQQFFSYLDDARIAFESKCECNILAPFAALCRPSISRTRSTTAQNKISSFKCEAFSHTSEVAGRFRSRPLLK